MASVIERIGTWYRFGEFGPVYEVLGEGATLFKGGRTMRIRVLESGEELDYPVSAILDDPRED